MKKRTKTFYDVEHHEDINQIKEIITKHGGKVLSQNFDYDEEEVTLEFEVPDEFDDLIKADAEADYWFRQ